MYQNISRLLQFGIICIVSFIYLFSYLLIASEAGDHMTLSALITPLPAPLCDYAG